MTVTRYQPPLPITRPVKSMAGRDYRTGHELRVGQCRSVSAQAQHRQDEQNHDDQANDIDDIAHYSSPCCPDERGPAWQAPRLPSATSVANLQHPSSEAARL